MFKSASTQSRCNFFSIFSICLIQRLVFSSMGGHLTAETISEKWVRGNAWITLVIPEILQLVNLSETDSFRVFLADIFRSQTSALAKFQDCESGMFFTVLDAPQDEQNYVEASECYCRLRLWNYEGDQTGTHRPIVPRSGEQKFQGCSRTSST
jgi:hypothetical protein